MSDNENGSARCGNAECGYVFHGDNINPISNEKAPCPQCGSLKRNYSYTLNTSVEMVTYLQMEMRKPDSNHKDNKPDLEGAKGITVGGDGEHVFKKRVYNRINPESEGSYIEYVRKYDGTILANKCEKLIKHTNKKK
jgi:hypothetical protein